MCQQSVVGEAAALEFVLVGESGESRCVVGESGVRQCAVGVSVVLGHVEVVGSVGNKLRKSFNLSV